MRTAAVLICCLATQGCLVLGLDRFYDPDAIEFEEGLLGAWRAVDDNLRLTVERSEWRSYKVTFEYTIEKGVLTGYLFRSGASRYLDLAPVRGVDPGSFVLPGHGLARLTIADGQVTLAPLNYDWFVKGLAAGTVPAVLKAVRAERDQVALAASRGALLKWLAARPAVDPAFGPDTTFTR